MSHDEWTKRRKQNMRDTALEHSRQLHEHKMSVINKNLQKEKKEDEPEPEITEDDLWQPELEDVIQDADKIYNFIKNGSTEGI